MKEMLCRWPHLWHINQCMASPNFVVDIAIYSLKLHKTGMAWPRLKAQCFGACLWMDLLSHDSQPERSTIKKSVTVRCLRKKPVTKCNSKQRLREDFCLQVEKTSRSLFQEVPAGKTPPSRSLLWQSSCYAFAASSTVIHTFYHDLMHSWIHSTSVTSSEKNLFLMTQLSSVQFLLNHIAVCHFVLPCKKN